MSNNIHNIHTDLSKLQLTNLSADQHQFINKIIEGNPDPMYGWSKIKLLAKSVNIIQIKNLIKAIDNEILRSSYFSLTNPYSCFLYKIALKKVSKILKNVAYINMFNKTGPSKPANKYFDELDYLFSETNIKYNGELMLPVTQSFDERLGASDGECSGYVIQWSLSLLDNHMAFGIDAKERPLFGPIHFNPKIRANYKNINHLAFLTEKMSKYQTIQGPDRLKPFLEKEGFDFTEVKSRQTLKSGEKLAQELISYADKTSSFIYFSNFIYYISLIGYRSHAVGFCKLDSQYHFFDCNTGWFRFKNSNDFESWLSFYLKLLGTNYIDYVISTISVISLADQENHNHNKELTTMQIACATPCLLVLSPFIALYLIGLISETATRSFYYLAKHTLTRKEIFLVNSYNNSIKPTSTYDLPQSRQLEALDLAIAPEFIMSKPRKIFDNAYIDNDVLSCNTAALTFFSSKKCTDPLRHTTSSTNLANNQAQSSVEDDLLNESYIFNPMWLNKYQRTNTDDLDIIQRSTKTF